MNLLSEYLLDMGVESIYFGAGARNSSLVENLKEFTQTFFLDERIASFAALGAAKITKKPIVVCTTSGTAVAECLAAVIEAYYSDIPLIIISADRPKRLRHTHAPQTIDQTNIFTNYVKTKYSGPLDKLSLDEIEYPLHINIEIDDTELIAIERIREINSDEFSRKFNSAKNVLAVFTEGSESFASELNQLDELNCLIYIECTSGLKSEKLKNQIRFEQNILKLAENKGIDLVIKFGKTPFTKFWRLLDQKYKQIEIVSYQNKKTGLARGFISNMIPKGMIPKEKISIKENKPQDYIELLPNSEISIYQKIKETIKEDDIVFVGNSMPIRYWQLVHSGQSRVYASRGANGIDGQIATSIGIAKNTHKNVHCVIGDLTFLYDLSSCLEELPSNLKIHVINNYGGRIFDRVSVDKKMVLSHGHSIKELINGFKSKNKIIEYLSNKEETEHFWSLWENDL